MSLISQINAEQYFSENQGNLQANYFLPHACRSERLRTHPAQTGDYKRIETHRFSYENSLYISVTPWSSVA